MSALACDEIWAQVDAYLNEVEQDLRLSRKHFVEWELPETITAVTVEEVLLLPTEEKDDAP